MDANVTEGMRPELMAIDLAPTEELVRTMNADDSTVLQAVTAAAPAIARAIDGIVERLGRGGRLVYVGAGTAGRIGVLDAVECGPTFNTTQVVAVIPGGIAAFADEGQGVEDDAGAGADALAALDVSTDDAVVAISASGRTPYVVGAVAHARARNALTAAVVCNRGSELAANVVHLIELVVGPEFIAGSTRLKAGTAQKLVVNMLSTIAMVKLGKTYGNLMVDVRAENEKLRGRAIRIVAQAAGVAEPDAAAALAEAGGDAKLAILMRLRGLHAGDAQQRLEASDRDLRRALLEAG